VKKLKEEIDRWSTGDGKKKAKGSLIVEFSIENIQVTKRRSASQKEQAAIHVHTDSKTSDHKRLKDVAVVNIKKSDEPPVKKRRTTDKQIAAKTKSEPTGEADPKVKPANPLGALIGRKRKERKSGKKGGR